MTITAYDDRYEVRYKLPPFHEVVVETENGSFSRIVFENDDDFFEDGYDGQPALPVKSILLQLPDKTKKIALKVHDYFDDFQSVVLHYPYLPAQNGLEIGLLHAIKFL